MSDFLAGTDQATGPERPGRRDRSGSPAAPLHEQQLAALQNAAGNDAVSAWMTPAGPAGPSSVGPDGIVTITVSGGRRGPKVRHGGTGVEFSDDPVQVRAELEYYVQQHGLPTLGAFETDSLWIPVPDDATASAEPDPAYLQRVISTVGTEVRSLRTRIEQFLDDFEFEANRAVQSILDDSQARIQAELERYGIKPETSFFASPDPAATTGADSYSGATNEVSGKLAGAARTLQGLLPGVRAAKADYDEVASRDDQAFSTDWSGQLAQRDAAGRKYHAVRQEYDLARADAEAQYPTLRAFELTPDGPGTAERLAQLATGDKATAIGEMLNGRLADIARVRAAVDADPSYVWKVEKLVGLTRQLPGVVGNPFLPNRQVQTAAVLEKVAGDDSTDAVFGVLKSILSLGLGMIAAVPTGGASIAAAVAGGMAMGADVALNAVAIKDALQTYQLESALGGTDIERAKALSSQTPSLMWLALDLFGSSLSIGGEAGTAIKLFRSVESAREQVLAAKALAEASQASGVATSAEAQYSRALEELGSAAEQAVPGAGPRARGEFERVGANIVGTSDSRVPVAGATVAGPAGAEAIAAGMGISREEAYLEYMRMINTDASREYGLVQHRDTKLYRVIAGDTIGVSAEKGWQFVRHFHPNVAYDEIKDIWYAIAEGRFSARVPSAKLGDLEYAAGMAGKTPHPVVSAIDWWNPATKEMGTSRFGFTPGEKEPFWIEFPNEKGQIIKETMANLDRAEAYVAQAARGGIEPRGRWAKERQARRIADQEAPTLRGKALEDAMDKQRLADTQEAAETATPLDGPGVLRTLTPAEELKWGAEKILNLGGRAESTGAVDMNNNLADTVVRPPGTWIQQDFTEPWPIPSGFLDKVIANKFPMTYGAPMERMLAEAARCLKDGGVIELWMTTRDTGPSLIEALEKSKLFSEVKPWRGSHGVRAIK